MITNFDIQKVIRQVAELYGQAPSQVRQSIKVVITESRANTDDRYVGAFLYQNNEYQGMFEID